MAAKTNLFPGRLSDDDAVLFYKLWLGLLNFVNTKYNITPSLGKLVSPKGLDITKLLPLRNKLWEDVSVIDEYIDAEKSLNAEEISILNGWKKAVDRDFILMKHYKNYSVLMTTERTPLLYGAIGIYSTWSEMIPKEVLPAAVQCALLPFQGKIIYDSFMFGGNISYGSGYRKEFNESYQGAKELYGIIDSFDNLDALLAQHASDSIRKDRILDKILADVYDEHGEASAWHRYMRDNLIFPFDAVVSRQILRSPLLPGEHVKVTGLAGIDKRCDGIAVIILWQEREFAVPLEQLTPVDVPEKTSEAAEDWRYWIAAGCFAE